MSASLPAELKTEAALELLGRSDGRNCPLGILPHRRRKGGYGRPPDMYKTEHILRARDLMEQARVSFVDACRIVLAEIEGRLPRPEAK